MQKSGSRTAGRNAFFLSSQTADFRNDPSGFRQLLRDGIHRQVTFDSTSQRFATNSTGRSPPAHLPHYFLWEDLTAIGGKPARVNCHWRLTRLAVSPHGGQPAWRLITNQLTTRIDHWSSCVWKVDNISLCRIYSWNLFRIDFLMI